MISFEIFLNGTRLNVAGIKSEAGVLTSIVTWVKRKNENNDEIFLDVSGSDSSQQKSLKWIDTKLHLNDEIHIKITGNDQIDQPEIKKADYHAALLESKLKSYYRLKEELKDHIDE